MKLHLPKMLTAALLAAFATFTQAQAAAPQTIGQTLTWDAGNADAAHGKYVMTTFDEQGGVTYGTTYQGWNQAGMQQFFYNQMGNRNTLRFSSDKGTSQKSIQYTFNWFTVGGIMVDTGATGFDIHTSGTADRSFYLGTTVSGTTAYSTIREDFSLMQTSPNEKALIHLQGNQVFDVESGNTFHLKQSNNYALDFDTQLVVKGGGTVAFDGTSAVAMTGASSLDVQDGSTVTFGANVTGLSHTITNAGTVNFGGTVSVTDFSGFKGNVNYSDEGNGFILSATYNIWEGEGTVTGLTEISHGGKTLAVQEKAVTVDTADYASYHLNTQGASVVLDDAAATALEKGVTLTTVNVKNTGATVTVNSPLALPTLSIASGADATIDGTGTLTLTTLNNSGTVNIAAGLTMANAVNYTSSETPAIHVKEGGVLTILSNSKVDNAQIGSGTGTSEQTNGSFSKLFTGKVIDVQEGGKLVLKGNVLVCDTTTSKTSATMVSGLSELEIQGGFQINTYAVNPGTTWELRDHTMRATDYLWLTNHQFLTVAGGTVETGQLRLGHGSNTDGGSYPAKFTAANDSNVILGGIAMYGGHNEVSINGSTLTFTKAEGNVLSQAKNQPSAAADLNKVVFHNSTLNAINNGWTLETIGGTTIALTGTNTVNVAAGKAVTLSANSIEGTLAKDGEGALTLAGTSARTAIGKTIALNKGTLTMSGNFSIDDMEVGDEVVTWVRDEGIAEGSGFKAVSGTVTVVAKGEGTTLNVSGANVTREGVAVTLADTGIVTLTPIANYSTLWVNGTGDVSYNAAQTLAGDTTVGTVHLNAEDATITMDKADASVALVLSEGISGTVKATDATTLSSVTGLGEDNILTITGSAPVTFGAAVSGGTVSVDNGTLNLGNAIHNLAKLGVTNGTVTAVGVNSGNGCISGTITIGDDGVFQTTGHNDVFGYNDNATDKIVMGGSYDHIASLQMTPDGDDTVTMTTDIEMNGYAAITSKTGFNTFGGTITATGVDNTIDKVWLRKDVTITVAEDGDELSIGKLQRFSGFDGTIIKEGEGTLVLNGTENVLDKAITVNAGTLVFDGTFAIDGIGHTGDTNSYTGGEVQGNGFLTTIAKRTVVTGDGNVDAENAVFTVGDQEGEYEGGVVTSTTSDYATFYVNSSSEKVSTATQQGALENIVVVTGAKLVVDEDYDSANISAAIDIADVEVLSGKKLNGTIANMTLSGAGTYALDNATSALGTNVTLDEAWTGTVAVSGASINNINLNNYGHEGSKVAMDGVSGYFLQAQEVFAPELVLEGAGLTLTDGFSTLASGNPKPPTTYTFAGGVSGEGDMTFSHKNGTASNVTQHLYFTGDVSDWNGSLNVVAGFTVYAQFSGEDKTVGATITRTNGTLNVEVGTGSDASDVTFTQSITSNRLDVLAGASATLLGDLNASTITVAGDASLTMTDGGTLSSAITSAGTVTLTGVTLSDAFEEVPGGEVKYDIADTLNYYMGTSNSYITVVTGDGAANATGSDLTWKDKTGLSMVDGQVITSAGSINYSTLYIGGGETTTEQIAGYEHASDLTGIVVETGTLTVNQPLTGIGIEVSEYGTIAGNVTPTEVGIAAGATAEFTADVAGTGYKFSAAEDGTVTVVNGGETTTTYIGSDRNLTVKADTLAAETDWSEVTISNKVQVDNVQAANYSILALDNVAEGSLELQNLTIGAMAYVQVYASDNHASDNEATVVISDTLTAGTMSTLNADLTMKADSTLALVGSSDMALTLGSKLTFDTTDGLVNLGEDVIAYLSAMNVGDSVAFFTHGVGTTLDYGDEYNGMYYDDLFVRTGALVGDFKVYADGTSFGLTKYYNMPEPTTGTLSLLALAALAARRRRK